LIKQDNSPEASLPTQAVEGGRQDVFGSGMIVDYNQVFEHARIVEKAVKRIVTSLSLITKKPDLWIGLIFTLCWKAANLKIRQKNA
jgi:hypothetical protein